ncbi:MAG: hypothetical protein KatS3mg039_1117 [Candidatus Kapaibacterium sp.]|nr:MAG: hypothetical protein KatS3mg039_1117 [Candidatus Kapabacteria bacterium]
MQFRKHVPLLSWTAGDKVLFFGYGIVTWLQIRALAPEEYGLAAQLLTLQAWIAIVAEGSLLQSVIQYGQDTTERGRVNFLAFVLHGCFTLGIATTIALGGNVLARLFDEPRFGNVAAVLPLYCALGIPRSYALKLLQRELRARDVFLTNAAWLGSCTALTIVMLWRGTLDRFEDMALIACGGMAIGSAVGLILAADLIRWSLQGSLRLGAVLRFSLPQAVMMALATSVRQLDLFLVQLFFSTRAAGMYNAAKMLYRVFETGADAASWLMYPTAVRLLHQERLDELRAVIGKALVVQMAIAIGCVGILELGGSAIVVSFLGTRYAETSAMFNVMAIGALFLPFAMLQSVHLALHRVDRLLAITAIGVGAALGAYLASGIAGALWLIGSGVVVYAAVTALLFWFTLHSDGIIRSRDVRHVLLDLRNDLGAVMRQRLRITPRSE